MANPALRSGDKAMQRKLKAMWDFRVVDLGEQNRLEAEFESLGYCGVCTLQPGDTLPPSRSRPPPCVLTATPMLQGLVVLEGPSRSATAKAGTLLGGWGGQSPQLPRNRPNRTGTLGGQY